MKEEDLDRFQEMLTEIESSQIKVLTMANERLRRKIRRLHQAVVVICVIFSAALGFVWGIR